MPTLAIMRTNPKCSNSALGERSFDILHLQSRNASLTETNHIFSLPVKSDARDFLLNQAKLSLGWYLRVKVTILGEAAAMVYQITFHLPAPNRFAVSQKVTFPGHGSFGTILLFHQKTKAERRRTMRTKTEKKKDRQGKIQNTKMTSIKQSRTFEKTNNTHVKKKKAILSSSRHFFSSSPLKSFRILQRG